MKSAPVTIPGRLSPSLPLRWISPLQAPGQIPNPPPSPAPPSRPPRKYIPHDVAVTLIARERDPKLAIRLFESLSSQKGFSHNNATYSAVIFRLARSKCFDAVESLLCRMPYETCKFHEGIFVNLMGHYSKHRMHQRAVEMLAMIRPIVRERPSMKAVSTCLNLLVEGNRMDLAKEALLYCKKELRLRPNSCIFNIFVKYHCRNGDIESAKCIVEEMRLSKCSHPNLITYSTLMDCLCQNGRLEEAFQLFEEMVGKDGIVPDELTYNVLINGFVMDGKVDRARRIMEFMRSKGCPPNVFNYATLMNGLCKDGKMNKAGEALEEMKRCGLKPDAVVYTTLINSLCRSGRTDEAIALLEEMKGTGCKADIVTFNVLLVGLCKEGRLMEAQGMVERLPRDGIHLNKASYRIVLNGLLHGGKLEKTMQFLFLMLNRGFLPHYATSNELLESLCKGGMVRDSAEALVELVGMGFIPKLEVWCLVIEAICRERKLLPAFELLDELREWLGYVCLLLKAIANIKKAVVEALDKQYADVLAPLKDNLVPKKFSLKYVQKLAKRSVCSYVVPNELGVLLNSLKRMLDILRPKMEVQFKTWGSCMPDSGNKAPAERLSEVTVMLRAKFRNYLQAVMEKLVENSKLQPSTKLKKILQDSKDGTVIESDVRGTMQPLKEQLAATMNQLHTLFETQVFISLCRGYWDRMGQDILSFLENRKENRSWYKGSRIAVSVLDDTFASQMQQLLGNAIQEKDLEPPRSIMEVRSILCKDAPNHKDGSPYYY